MDFIEKQKLWLEKYKKDQRTWELASLYERVVFYQESLARYEYKIEMLQKGLMPDGSSKVFNEKLRREFIRKYKSYRNEKKAELIWESEKLAKMLFGYELPI